MAMRNFNSSKVSDVILNGLILIIRLFVGISMLTHGLPKLETLILNNQIQFMSFLGMGSIFTMVLVVLAEFLCSIFIIIGLFTRIACIPLMFTMGVAFFLVHKADVYADKELSIMYFFIYLVILTLGSGKFSVDQLMTKKKQAY